MNILFVTWDGPQVYYLESLFLPIFSRLRTMGIKFHVLQFSWADLNRVTYTRNICEQAAIPYQAVKVWRQPIQIGSLLTVLLGAGKIRKIAQEWSIDVLMPRSTLPALMCLRTLESVHLPVIFDADGLPLDERIDFANVSASSVVNRVLRDIEAEMVRRADRVLTRTSRAADILFARAGAKTSADKFHVVGNGRDHNQFSVNPEVSAATRHALGIDTSDPLLVYAGSLGEQYCVTEMLQLFRAVLVRKPNARLLILSGTPELANLSLSNFPKLRRSTIIKRVPATEVPQYLACADLGLALRRQSFSMQAVAPIKIGEYLLCGLPVVASNGIGDTSYIRNDIGFLVDRMDEDELETVADWFCSKVLQDREGFARRCRTQGLESFSLDTCVGEYVSALRGLQQDIAASSRFLKTDTGSRLLAADRQIP